MTNGEIPFYRMTALQNDITYIEDLLDKCEIIDAAFAMRDFNILTVLQGRDKILESNVVYALRSEVDDLFTKARKKCICNKNVNV